MMKKKVGLLGIDKVMKNLNREVAKIEKRTLKGLILAAIYIKTEMEDKEPKIPIDTGNLRASFFIVTAKSKEKTGGDEGAFKGDRSSEMAMNHTMVQSVSQAEAASKDFPYLILGFSANYAIFVHEMAASEAGKMINWNRPGSGAKFLEEAINRNHEQILKIIAENVKIEK